MTNHLKNKHQLTDPTSKNLTNEQDIPNPSTADQKLLTYETRLSTIENLKGTF